MDNFLISLCIIAYNEQGCLGDLFDDIMAQTYPKDKTQIVLVDSASTDKTREVFELFKADHEDEYHSIIIAENPKRILPAGWNFAITQSSGDIIIRVDAHAQIPPEFIERNAAHHAEGEMVTGGIRPNIIDEETPYKRTLLMAESSMFGSSAADFRRSTKKKYTKSLFHGAYRREVFEKVGFYNEALVRTEDNEMHLRIRDAGYNLCLCSDIISYQQTRNSLRKMLNQKYGNGYWVGRTLGICPRCLSIYHFVPFAFVCGIIGACLLSLLLSWTFFALYFGIYFACAIAMGIMAIVTEPQKHIVSAILPILFFLLHVSYGVGTAAGLLSLIFKRVKKVK